MKFTTSLAMGALLASSTALAAPHDRRQFSGFGGGDSKFTSGGKSDQPWGNGFAAADGSSSAVSSSNCDEDANYMINENWAGVVLESAPASSATYTYVAATFTLPSVTPTAAPSSSDTQAVSFWVGIDGATAGNSIWQTGVDIYVDSNNETSFAAWYEWYPLNSVNVEMDFSIGDVVFASVEATSDSTGTAIIENRTTGKSITMHGSAPDTASKLQGQNAEWIVEDLAVDGDGFTFLDFGDAFFTGCVAKTADGKEYNLASDSAALYAVQDTHSSSVQAVPKILGNEKLQVTFQ
ncbi:A4/G1 family peptidase [Aspergillus homomorphus CBS 101889]|uniref:Concanavalin A-like lectin/glucanase n=1 Tax=Aspergillus homomorphus (strain CBS 101889) TaxID=1450537 RepID=A0A395HV26_ASPHC|nr:concanavalin A-like lectin/glucanase [Aspergillus homomorphus CBS 101889]RAL11376.1 concanavalin A-like lectin/glucanase [Aspergillus homomorphus CBS 101889]